MPAPMTNVVPLLPLIDAVTARLNGQLPKPGPDATTGYLSKPVNVPELADKVHVQRYWVLHPFVGTPSREPDLADTTVDRDWAFQVTVVAAFPRDAYAL